MADMVSAGGITNTTMALTDDLAIRPAFNRLVVRVIEEEDRVTPRGLVIPKAIVKDRATRGVVVAVGPGKRLDDGTYLAMPFQIGDLVHFPRISGVDLKSTLRDLATKTDTPGYLILREDDILAVEIPDGES